MLILVCKYFVIALIFKRFTECHFSFDCGKENIIQKLSFWNWGQNYADGYIFLFHNIFFSLSCCGNSADCSHCRPTTVDPEIILLLTTLSLSWNWKVVSDVYILFYTLHLMLHYAVLFPCLSFASLKAFVQVVKATQFFLYLHFILVLVYQVSIVGQGSWVL